MAEKVETAETKTEETATERAIGVHMDRLHDQRVNERSYPPK